MLKLRQLASFIVLIVTSTLALSAQINDQSLSKIMNLSGANEQINEVPTVLIEGLSQARSQGTPISEKEFSDMSKSIAEYFNPTQILKVVSDEQKQVLTDKDAKILLEWFESDLGKEITKAEVQATSMQALQEMMAQAASLMANQERVQLAIEFMKTTKALEGTLVMQEDTAVAIYAAMSSTKAPGQPINTKAYRQQVSSQMASMESQFEQMMILSFVYTYRNISIEDFKKYIEFNKTEAATKFNDAGMKSISKAMSLSTADL